MAETAEFTIGTDVICSDGDCGDVRRIVVDPIAREITHLVVEPRHRHKGGRLVPLALVQAATDQVRLRCTLAEFGNLDPAEETQFLPPAMGFAGYEPEQVLFHPYYPLGGGWGLGAGMSGRVALASDTSPGAENVAHIVVRESVPLGEVQVRRGEHVQAADGEIGLVQGLVIDPSSHHVTHVLLQEGHLWGEKEVAIPIGAVTGFQDGIRLSMTKEQLGDLPSVDIDHSHA